MNNDNKPTLPFLNVTQDEIVELLEPGKNPDSTTKFGLFLLSLIFSPISLLGALNFYKRGYARFMQPNNETPRLNNLRPIILVGMIIGVLSIWIGIFFALKLLVPFIIWATGDTFKRTPQMVYIILGLNLVITFFVFRWFNRWRAGMTKYIAAKTSKGTARFATWKELAPFAKKAQGFFLGSNTFYSKAGHILTVAKTRSGKSVFSILQNLLRPYLFPKMSWVIIDPKGELASICARILKLFGKKVVIMNPWQLLGMQDCPYNPLDILKSDRLNLADDVAMITEALVPSVDGKNDHWTLRARSFIAGLLLHLVTSAPKQDRHLGTLWQWLRLDNDKWIELLADMHGNEDENVGEIVRATANEIRALMTSSPEEYGSVISSAQRSTDWLKSPALRESMQTSNEFSHEDLASGQVMVFIVIPFDRISSHSAWSRLIVTSLMKSVVRNPKNEVTFLIEEAYAFGYHSEIDLAMGAYAGFGIHIWSIWQNLTQLKKVYKDNFENFISCCAVKQFFAMDDNFSTEYISTYFGKTSIPRYDKDGNLEGADERALVTHDELRTEKGEFIYTVIDNLHPARITKRAYYLDKNLPADPNPYYKPEPEEETESPEEEYASRLLKRYE